MPVTYPRWWAALVLSAIALAANRLEAQTTAPQSAVPQPILSVGPDRALGPPSSFPEVEPHVSVNQRRPAHMVVASMTVLTTDLAQIDCTIFTSFDGGSSWRSTRLSSLGHSQAKGCADPWTAILRNGTALISVLGDSGIVVFRSSDGGRTWTEPPLLVRGAHDHEMMVVDTTGGVVYLVSGQVTRNTRGERRDAVFVARSSDDGRTFTTAAQKVFSNLAYEAQTPVVLSNGTLVISYLDHRDASNRRLERRRVWVATSADRGVSYSEPMLVTESCNRRGPVSWPAFAAAGPGTEYTDRLYFTCEAHENRGILFASSKDRGHLWSPALRADSLSGGSAKSDSVWTKTPVLAVSPSGVVVLTWYDRRDDPRRQCQHLYATASVDGGTTFLPAVRVSQAASCPAEGTDVTARFPSGGEYSGLVSVGPREFLAVWADSRSGKFQLRTARISVGR